MTQATKTQKQVQVIARYQIKRNGYVVYTVRSSNGQDTYTTTLVNGKATGCSCPSYKPCYHMIQLEAREVERNESQKQVSTPAPRFAREGKPFASYRDEQGQHSVSCVGHEIVDVVVVPMSSEVMAEIAIREEVVAERKLATFERAMDEQYASDPRQGLSQGEVEAARSTMVHLYDEY